MAVVPIKRTREGKQIVLCAWVRNVADECVDPGLVEGEPGGVKVSYDGSGENEVAVMEIMVVVGFWTISSASKRLYG